MFRNFSIPSRYLWLLAPALLVLGMAAWSLIRLMEPPPYLGLELSGPGFFVHAVEEPAVSAGIRQGDRILSIEGEALSRRSTLTQGVAVGQQVPVSYRRGDENVSTVILAWPVAEREWYFNLIRLLIGSVFWFVSLLVIVLRPSHRNAWLFFALGQVIACILVADILDPDVLGMVYLSDGLMLLVGPVAMHFLSAFPSQIAGRIWKSLPIATYAVAAVLVVIMLLAVIAGIGPGETESFWLTLRIFPVVTLLAAMVILFIPRGTTSPVIEPRRRLLIASMMAGMMPAILFTLLPDVILARPLLDFVITVPFLILIPLGLAYAVNKGELGQLDFVLSRTLVWFGIGCVIFLLYAVLYLKAHPSRLADFSMLEVFLISCLLMAVGAVLMPLGRRLHAAVDRYFYGASYDYRSVVSNTSRQLPKVTSRHELVRQIFDTMRLMRFRSALLLWPKGGQFIPIGNAGWASEDLLRASFTTGGHLAHTLEGAGGPVFSHRLPSLAATQRMDPAERFLLSHPSARLFIPLCCHGRLCALLVVSDRQSAEVLHAEDLDILATFSGQAAVACENIMLIESLRARLEQLERARDELAEAKQRLAEGREAERMALARELHDGAVQDLYAMAHGVEVLISAHADEALRGRLDHLRESVFEIAAVLRRICVALRPPLLEAAGLDAAIRALADATRERYPQLAVTLYLDGLNAPGDQHHLALYRVVQESLNNIGQHARAGRAEISSEVRDGHLILRIRDDGAGFVVPERLIELGRRGNLGLLGMAEWAESIGAILKIQSRPGNGTSVELSLPVEKSSAPAARAQTLI